MNKIHKLFSILVIGILFASCNKSDDTPVAPPRDYAVQYTTDLETINRYLDEYYMEVTPDYDVTFTKIPSPNPDGKVSIRNQTQYPLQFKTVTKDAVDYKVYYISFREGTRNQPTSIDSVYVSYKGKSIYHKNDEVLPSTTPATYVDNIYDQQFDYSQNPIWFKLEEVVAGWAEIVPLFKAGDFDTSSGPNPTTFTNFGAGVMFLPSGLGYFNSSPSGLIPQYSPLIFNFKLDNMRFRDHDQDGILSKDEVDPTVAGQKPADYDTDGDGHPNYIDLDDDGDHVLTKNEIKYVNPLDPNAVVHYYPFNGASVDDPATLYVDERQGIPRKFTGPLQNPSLPESATNHRTPLASDFTDPTRLRRHLDPTSYPPYE